MAKSLAKSLAEEKAENEEDEEDEEVEEDDDDTEEEEEKLAETFGSAEKPELRTMDHVLWAMVVLAFLSNMTFQLSDGADFPIVNWLIGRVFRICSWFVHYGNTACWNTGSQLCQHKLCTSLQGTPPLWFVVGLNGHCRG